MVKNHLADHGDLIHLGTMGGGRVLVYLATRGEWVTWSIMTFIHLSLKGGGRVKEGSGYY